MVAPAYNTHLTEQAAAARCRAAAAVAESSEAEVTFYPLSSWSAAGQSVALFSPFAR